MIPVYLEGDFKVYTLFHCIHSIVVEIFNLHHKREPHGGTKNQRKLRTRIYPLSTTNICPNFMEIMSVFVEKFQSDEVVHWPSVQHCQFLYYI